MTTPKLPLLAERDLLILDPWDAMHNPPQSAQAKLLITFRKTAGLPITLRIYGTIAPSEVTGELTVEEMTIMWGESDVTNNIPESKMVEWVEEIVQEKESG